MNPAHAKLGDVATIQLGLTFRGSDATRHNPAGTHQLIRISDLADDGALTITIPNLIGLDASVAQRYALQRGDVILAARGVRLTAAVFDCPAPSVAGNQFCIIRVKPGVALPAFLRWFLNLSTTQEHLRAEMTGSYVRALPVGQLAALEIPLPALPVQSALVELDSLRTRERKLLAEIATKRSRLIDQSMLKIFSQQ